MHCKSMWRRKTIDGWVRISWCVRVTSIKR